MMLLADDITSVLWIAVVPAFLSVVLVLTAVHEPASGPQAPEPGSRLMFASVSQLPRRYWHVVLLGAVFTLARFSEAFLILRARDVGLAIGYVPAVMIVMNVFYAGFAYPAGAAGDRYPARKVLVFGLVLLFAADVVLALASSPAVAFLGSALWGLHMACTQGLFPKLVADTAPPGMRGTAFGVFSLITGAAVVLASILAGSLWSNMGAPATFVAGASFALVAAIGVLLYRDRKE
jgi:MFS family permease